MPDIRRAATGAFGVNILSAGLVFSLHVAFARMMPADQYGLYVLAFTWITVLAIVCKFGWDTALVRYVAVYAAAGDTGSLYGIIRVSILATLASCLVCYLGLLAWPRSSEILDLLTGFAVLLLPVLSLVHVLQAILRGLKKVPLNELPDRLLRPILMIALAALIFVAGDDGMDAGEALGVHLLALALSGVFAAIMVGRCLPEKPRAESATYSTREWLGSTTLLAVFSALHFSLAQIDILMVGGMMSAADAAIYSVAARISVFIIFGLTAINAIAAPIIAEQYAKGNTAELQAMLTKSARAALAFAFTMVIAFWLLGRPVLGMFGEQYGAGYATLLILGAAHVANAGFGSVGFLLNMTGQQRISAGILVVAVVMNLILNAVLIPRYGIEGAAIATALTTVFWNAAMTVFAIRKLGLNPTAVGAATA